MSCTDTIIPTAIISNLSMPSPRRRPGSIVKRKVTDKIAYRISHGEMGPGFRRGDVDYRSEPITVGITSLLISHPRESGNPRHFNLTSAHRRDAEDAREKRRGTAPLFSFLHRLCVLCASCGSDFLSALLDSRFRGNDYKIGYKITGASL